MHYYPGAAERLSDWKSKQSIPIIIEWSKQRLEQLDSRLQAPLPTISSRDATPKKVEEEAKKRAKEEAKEMAKENAKKMGGSRGCKENGRLKRKQGKLPRKRLSKKRKQKFKVQMISWLEIIILFLEPKKELNSMKGWNLN